RGTRHPEYTPGGTMACLESGLVGPEVNGRSTTFPAIWLAASYDRAVCAAMGWWSHFFFASSMTVTWHRVQRNTSLSLPKARQSLRTWIMSLPHAGHIGTGMSFSVPMVVSGHNLKDRHLDPAQQCRPSRDVPVLTEGLG